MAIQAIILALLTGRALVAAQAGSFGLYVYGPDGDGSPLMFKDGLATIVPPSSNRSTYYDEMQFIYQAEDYELVAIPVNSTSDSAGNLTFGFDKISGAVGINATENSDFTKSRWVFYGSTLMLQDSNAELLTLFRTLDRNTTELGIAWNSSVGGPLTIRTVAPSNQ